MEKTFASIITIGDELLIGQVIDTNSAWMAQELNKMGMLVRRRVAVGDNWDDIWKALDEESQTASLVLITGGLGPTADDITKQLLCRYFDGKMVVHEPTLRRIKHLFETVLKRPMIERNAQQAEVPDTCTVLENERGTAPGMLFEKEGKVFVSLPGVPYEMKWLMEHKVLPLIPQYFTTGVVAHRTLLTAGIGESYLAEQIRDIEESLLPHIKLAYLPNFGMVRLRLTGFGSDLAELNSDLDTSFARLKERVAEFLVIDEDIPMEQAVAKLLLKSGKTMAVAESCTGGYIAHLVTAHAGSSAYFKGGVVTYANEAKEEVLQVPHEVLANDGAVSEATVSAMVRHVRELMQTDYAVAVSGIMGPGGGSAEKPVGTVWMAVAGPEKVQTQLFSFRYDRRRNIEMTAYNALNLLRRFIIENPD